MPEPSIKEHMEVIGADGVHIGTVDRVENGRIKLTKVDSGTHEMPSGARVGMHQLPSLPPDVMRLRTIGPRSLRNGPSGLTGCPSVFGVIVCSPVSG